MFAVRPDRRPSGAGGDAAFESRQGVRFEGVSKTYEGSTVAVDSIDLECPAGEITVFVGPSGCGKTTTLRMINRTVLPTKGTVSLGSRDVSQLGLNELRRGMGYVIQDGGLFPHRTIQQNVATIPLLTGTPKRQAYAQAVELLARVGLSQDLAKRYPYQLSGGQRQRVGVARALAGDPPVLLMDEPFSAVDPVVRGELQQELLQLQRELRKTIVFVTHDMDEAVLLGDRIAVFAEGGRLAQVAPPEAILTDPADPFVENFVGGDAGVRWTGLLPATDVALSRPPTMTDTENQSADTWRLRIDSSGRLLGWQPPGTASPDALVPCRRTFRPDREPVRAVLDALLLSPCGLAPAVDADAHLIGVADAAAVGDVLTTHRGQVS